MCNLSHLNSRSATKTVIYELSNGIVVHAISDNYTPTPLETVSKRLDPLIKVEILMPLLHTPWSMSSTWHLYERVQRHRPALKCRYLRDRDVKYSIFAIISKATG